MLDPLGDGPADPGLGEPCLFKSDWKPYFLVG